MKRSDKSKNKSAALKKCGQSKIPAGHKRRLIGVALAVLVVAAVILAVVLTRPRKNYRYPAPHPVDFKDNALLKSLNRDGLYVSQYMWDALRAAGLSNEASAAILGNVWAESRFDVGALEDGESYAEVMARDDRGLGLFQWTSPEYKKELLEVAQSAGLPWDALRAQMTCFLGQTFEIGGKAPSRGNWAARDSLRIYENIYRNYPHEPFENPAAFAASHDLTRCVIVFCANWEVPEAPHANIAARLAVAQSFLQAYGGRSFMNPSPTPGATYR